MASTQGRLIMGYSGLAMSNTFIFLTAELKIEKWSVRYPVSCQVHYRTQCGCGETTICVKIHMICVKHTWTSDVKPWLRWEVECKGVCLPLGAAGVNGLHHSPLHESDFPIPRHQDHSIGSEWVEE